MKYEIRVAKKSGYEYRVEGNNLYVNDEKIINKTTAPEEVTETQAAQGISRYYLDETEGVVCCLTKYVDNLDPYKSGAGIKDGRKISFSSKWDFSRLMTPDEVINGNPLPAEEVIDA